VTTFLAGTRRRGGLSALAVGVVVLATFAAVLPGETGTRGAPTMEGGRIGEAAHSLPMAPSVERASRPAAPDIASPSWVNVTHTGPGQSPPQGNQGVTVYDPADQTTILFGGCDATQCPSNQTWTFSRGVWMNMTNPRDAPPARYFAAADYDANMGGVLLFGGRDAASTFLNDTWLYAGGHWTNLTYVGPAPSAREGATMAFDPEPEENGSILFGGCVPSGIAVVCTNDTWVWAGWSGWTLLAPSSPPPGVGFASAVFDPALGDLVLFGGCAGVFCSSAVNTTWEFYSGQWWPTSTLTFPAARAGAGMVYDPTIGTILMFGGENLDVGAFADTWEFASTGWSELNFTPSPSPRSWPGLALDGTGTTPILVGGAGNTTDLNDTWAFEVAPRVGLVASPTSAETSAPVEFTATVSGGTPPYALTVSYGDGSMDSVAGSGPTLQWTHAFPLPGNDTPTLRLIDAVGAAASAAGPTVHVGAGIGVVASVVPVATDVGRPVIFSANASPAGVAPVTYAWSLGDGSNGTDANWSHSYATAGVYAATVEATDADGARAAAAVDLTVVADPTVAPAATPSSPEASSVVSFFAGESGGTPPFQYAWKFGDGVASAQPSPGHAFAQAGTYSVQVWVNDSVGSSTHASLSVTVAASGASAPGSSSASPPTWFWVGLGGLVAVAVVGSVILLRTKAPPRPS
jgi:PKD repeat protein